MGFFIAWRNAMTSGIRDNHTFGKVGDFLAKKIVSDSELSIVSAYFSIYGFETLQKQLADIKNLRFLFGEPNFIEQIDPAKTESKTFDITEQGLGLKNRLEQKAIAKACADWIIHKVEIRSLIKSNLLHGKLYHINNHGIESAIVGSSNFTAQGLGYGTANIELNLIVDSDRDRQDLKAWFNSIWNDKTLVKDVKDQVLNYLAQIYANHSPEFIYYKTLYHLFDSYLKAQQEQLKLLENSAFKDTLIWQKLFQFQQNGVLSIIAKIQQNNGCILADSVGLGKTFEALAVIKYFELKNYNVLVLCPKKLEANWTQYPAHYHNNLNPFSTDRFRYTVLCHTDLSRESGQSNGINLATFNWNNFDLVVIDESHNFRNDSKGKKGKTRYQRLLEDIIKSGGQTKVLLLSATPVNNDLMDLHNQIRFISADNAHAFADLGINDLHKTFKNAQKTFLEWTKKSNNHHTTDLLNKLGSDFFKLLDELSIARSRKHIAKYYPDVVTELGGFPKREKPIAIYPNTDLLNKFPSFEQLNQEISNYKLALFNPSKYLLSEYQHLPAYQTKVKNFTQANREYYLIGMMKINFLKRMESSIYAFYLTMQRTVNKIDELINKLEDFAVQALPALQTELTVLEDDDEELNDAFSVGKKISFALKHLNCNDWLKDLKQDREQLIKLRDLAKQVTPPYDGKLKQLKELIYEKITQPTINKQGKENKKIIIFTAFADTANYLYDNLETWLHNNLNIHIALVAGTQCKTTLGKADYNEILINFSPISKERASFKHLPQQEEINILIATDCISEGQNLQDCDTVINYDIHWNPVRLIQRFGRIDRINSLNTSVTMINFWATKELDNYLGLENRVKSRMALVDITATGNDNLLAEELEQDIKDDIHYRDLQLKRMMNEEILDLEDVNNNVSLADFSLDDFRNDLHQYIMQNREKLANAPNGLYAVVPENKETTIVSGVIFCLEQKTMANQQNQVNPLSPYFLIYIQNNGQVIYNFAQAKQILTVFKALCLGVQTAYKDLCQLFDQQTQDGKEMSYYNNLLKQAITQLSAAFQQREIAHLQTGRGAKLLDINQRITEQTDFNLITWLIIMGDEQ